MMSSSVKPPRSHRSSPWGLLSLLPKVHSRKEAGPYVAAAGSALCLGGHPNAGPARVRWTLRGLQPIVPSPSTCE